MPVELAPRHEAAVVPDDIALDDRVVAGVVIAAPAVERGDARTGEAHVPCVVVHPAILDRDVVGLDRGDPATRALADLAVGDHHVMRLQLQLAALDEDAVGVELGVGLLALGIGQGLDQGQRVVVAAYRQAADALVRGMDQDAAPPGRMQHRVLAVACLPGDPGGGRARGCHDHDRRSGLNVAVDTVTDQHRVAGLYHRGCLGQGAEGLICGLAVMGVVAAAGDRPFLGGHDRGGQQGQGRAQQGRTQHGTEQGTRHGSTWSG